jgi:RimJ/RimL family protein N-acetyltransferase
MGAALKLERTEDVERIKAIVCHPEVFPHITDDDELVYVPIHPKIYYLILQMDEPVEIDAALPQDAGLVTFTPVNSCTWIPHVALMPEYRGFGLGVAAISLGMAWIFENVEACRKLVARPPEFNKAMIRVFEKCGFHQEGRSPKSFMRFGQLHDRVYYGFERD